MKRLGGITVGSELDISPYGTFLEVKPDKLIASQPFSNLESISIHRSRNGFAATIHQPGQVESIAQKARAWGVGFASFKRVAQDDYLFVSVVEYGDRAAIVRRSSALSWDFYIVREIIGGKETDTVAEGIVAPRWMGEEQNDVAVIDGIWSRCMGEAPYVHADNRSRRALLTAMEHELARDNRLVRCCRDWGLRTDQLFYTANDFRDLRRPDGDIVMAKVLCPKFDTLLLQYLPT